MIYRGYVRNLNIFGKKKFLNDSFLDQIFCLKGTKEELKYIPQDIIKRQKKKCLIITEGENGSAIYYKDKKFIFKPSKIIKTNVTIGAGDTFFANFVLNFIETGGNVTIAGRIATAETLKFLQQYEK